MRLIFQSSLSQFTYIILIHNIHVTRFTLVENETSPNAKWNRMRLEPVQMMAFVPVSTARKPQGISTGS
jgi:hypothetical protein